MKVAHVITRMIIGGAQENTLFNCDDLVRIHGDDVLLITGPALGPEGDLILKHRVTHGEDAIPFRVHEIDSLRRAIHPWRDWRALGAIRSALKSFAPDVVHTHSAKGGILGRQAAWSLGVRSIIHTVHGAPFHPYQNVVARNLFRLCERRAARQCHHLVCVADAMTDLLVDAGVAPREKFTTVYSGMNVDPFLSARNTRDAVRQRLGFGDDDIVIGKIARLFHLKGHDDVVDAAADVVRQHPKVRFLLIGDGTLRSVLEEKIQRLGLADAFVFTGLVPPEEIPSLVGACDALVHASYREGLARALPQALISGIPAISYDVDGAREVVINDETGYLVPPGDRTLLAKRISQIAADPQARQRMGRAGQGRFADQFRHETMTRRLREIYLQVGEK